SGMRLPDDRPHEIVIVYAKNPFSQGVVPPPKEIDQVIYNDRQPSPLMIYRRHWPRGTPEDFLKREYEIIVLPERGLVDEATKLAQKREFVEALNLFQRALAIKPTDSEAHYGAGFALVQLGQRAQGIPHLQEAIRLAPESALAYTLLGATLADQ